MLKCMPGMEKDIIGHLKAAPEVIEINGIWGKYDVLLKVSAPEIEDIENFLEKIRKMDEVLSSDTMHVIYGQGGTIDSS